MRPLIHRRPSNPKKTVIAPNVDLKTVISKPAPPEKPEPVFVPIDEIPPSAVVLPMHTPEITPTTPDTKAPLRDVSATAIFQANPISPDQPQGIDPSLTGSTAEAAQAIQSPPLIHPRRMS